MQEQAGLRQQVGSLTASLRVAEQAQSSAEAAVQEERLRSAEATQVNRLTTCVALLLPFPLPIPLPLPLPLPLLWPSATHHGVLGSCKWHSQKCLAFLVWAPHRAIMLPSDPFLPSRDYPSGPSVI